MSKEYRLLKPGFGYFEIFEALATDKDGNPLKTKNGLLMIKLKLQVTDSEGSTEIVYDYLMTIFQEKLNQFKRCIDFKGDIYGVQEKIKYKSGYCTIKTQFAEPGSQWGHRSTIASYLPKETLQILNSLHNLPKDEPVEQHKVSAKPAVKQNDDSDDFDDIPF